MTILAALLLLSQASPAEQPVTAPLPIDWANLPELALIKPAPAAPELAQFVRQEVAAGRCTAAQHGETGFTLHVELGVLIDRGGDARRIVPRAIGCPTVEQYSVGIVSRMTRANVTPPGADTWYRTAIDFAWKE